MQLNFSASWGNLSENEEDLVRSTIIRERMTIEHRMLLKDVLGNEFGKRSKNVIKHYHLWQHLSRLFAKIGFDTPAAIV